jgi:hypothetical protein
MKTKAMWLSSERARGFLASQFCNVGCGVGRPIGGYLGPTDGALTLLVAVLAGVPALHLWG